MVLKLNPATPRPNSYRGRLQRPPASTGYRVATFTDVLTRHGLTMTGLAALCLTMPGAWAMVQNTTSVAAAQPLYYLLGLGALLVFFCFWSARYSYPSRGQVSWTLYLLMISVAEELTFRLVLPNLLSMLTPMLTAHVVSNLLFASLHYFTLRWRLVNCIATFLGGMGLSHLMGHGDLLLVIMVHWLGTFMNTPCPPSKKPGSAG